MLQTMQLSNILFQKRQTLIPLSQSVYFFVKLQARHSLLLFSVSLAYKNGAAIEFDLYSCSQISSIFQQYNEKNNLIKWRVKNSSIQGVAKTQKNVIKQLKSQEFVMKFIHEVFDECFNQSAAMLQDILNFSSKNHYNCSKKLKKLRQFKQGNDFVQELKMKKEIMEILNMKEQLKEESEPLKKTEGTNLHKIKNMKYKRNNMEQKTIHGGVSSVEKIQISSLIYKENNEKKVLKDVFLAKKVEREPCMEKGNHRFIQELRVIRKINQIGGKKDYLLNYFYQEEKQHQEYYLQYLDMNLSQYLFYYGENLTYQTVISICQQIVFIVEDLHSMGIIHRDLKPTNFMVQRSSDGFAPPKIKLIDFSDSYIPDGPSIQIHATVPYSPLQCSRSSKLYYSQGFKEKAIDYWSVGILIHQIFYGYIPCTYSSAFSKDIHQLWLTQFLQYPLRKRKLSGWRAIEYGMNVLRQSLVVVDPKKRLELKKAEKILDVMKIYLSSLRKKGVFNLEKNKSDSTLQTMQNQADGKNNNFYSLKDACVQKVGKREAKTRVSLCDDFVY